MLVWLQAVLSCLELVKIHLGRLELRQLVVGSRGRQRDELQALARPLSRMDKRRVLVRLLQVNIKARLAHSARFAAVF
jgi:hypothetical protein